MSVSRVNGLSQDVSFKANKQAKPVSEQTQTDKKMSTGMKIGLGAAAIATAVIAGIAIKNRSASKAIEKAAQESGLDVETYKSLIQRMREFSKVEEFDIQSIGAKLAREGKLQETDRLRFVSGSNLRTLPEFKGYPENAINVSVIRGDDKLVYTENFLYDKIGSSERDIEMLEAFEKKHVYECSKLKFV